MADDDHRFAVVRHIVHDPVDDLAARLRQRRGCLVHDQQIRVVIHTLGDLDQLPILHIVHSGGQCRIDVFHTNLLQSFFCLGYHGPLVDQRPLLEPLVATQEYIFRHRDIGDGAGLLHNHADTRFLRIQHSGRFPGLSFIGHIAAGRGL